MNFSLSKEQEMIRDVVREFAEKEIKPIASEIDQQREIPPALIRKMGRIGLMGLTVPGEYGGAGCDRISYVIALEEISRYCGSTGITVEAHNSLGLGHIFERGTEALRKRLVPKLARGEWLGAWALTEPNAGSDAAAIETTAVRKGEEYVLNGSKCFVTGGSVADTIVVMAKTDKTKGAKGISAIVVEKGTPGLTYGKDEDKLGLRGSHTTELFLDDCRVPVENRLDKEGNGFIGAMQILDKGRTAIAAMAVGIARGALEECLRYVTEREQFGKPIGTFQGVRWMLADMATQLDAARLLVYRAADMEQKGLRCSKEASMAKLFASEMAMKATTDAIQIHGGYGYTTDYPLERYFRDVKLCEIGEGTNQIQKMIIARHLLKMR